MSNCENVKQILIDLINGNIQYMNNPIYQEERSETKLSQHPCIVVVSCSDSRVSIPLIFNYPQIGVFFEVKTAGQVLTSSDLESIKYAVDHLNPIAILMLEHTNCGAVIATIDSINDHKIRTEYPTITTSIINSVEKVMNNGLAREELIYHSIVQNIIDKSDQLTFLFGNKIIIVPALYNVSSGKVSFLK